MIDHSQLKTLNGNSKCKKQFDYSIMTDGIAMSLSCKKTIQEFSEKKRLQMMKQKLKDAQYEFILGLDPGYRLTLGGVRRQVGNAFERNIRLKCGKYYRYSHEFYRDKKKEKLFAELQQKLVEDGKRYQHTPSSKR